MSEKEGEEERGRVRHTGKQKKQEWHRKNQQNARMLMCAVIVPLECLWVTQVMTLNLGLDPKDDEKYWETFSFQGIMSEELYLIRINQFWQRKLLVWLLETCGFGTLTGLQLEFYSTLLVTNSWGIYSKLPAVTAEEVADVHYLKSVITCRGNNCGYVDTMRIQI